jgi:molybdate transport system substrate-binding protein
MAAALLVATHAHADEVSVGVAANFAAPMQRIAADFAQASGHRVVAAVGSTGALYAQIRNGAPFEALLAADAETPAKLEREGAAVAGSRFTYAVGTLVLWSARPDYVDERGAVLVTGTFRHLAIANPRLAPYGAAAIETLAALGARERLTPRLVQAENVAQAYQFVASGAAEIGFVALAQVIADGRIGSGSGWIVPATLHRPIRQDAVILAKGRGKAAVTALMEYLRGPQARAVIAAYGYAVAP